MGEQGVPGQTQTEKGSLQRAEARAGSLEEYKEILQAVRNEIKRSEALTELKAARDINGNKESFCRYVRD